MNSPPPLGVPRAVSASVPLSFSSILHQASPTPPHLGPRRAGGRRVRCRSSRRPRAPGGTSRTPLHRVGAPQTPTCTGEGWFSQGPGALPRSSGVPPLGRQGPNGSDARLVLRRERPVAPWTSARRCASSLKTCLPPPTSSLASSLSQLTSKSRHEFAI